MMQAEYEKVHPTRFPSLADGEAQVESSPHGSPEAKGRSEPSGIRRWFRRATHPSAHYWGDAAITAEWLGLAPAHADAWSEEGTERRASGEPLPLLPGTTVAGRYQIIALVGSGNFAAVYRARDRQVSDHIVALKLQHEEAASMQSKTAALRELHTLASVVHPSVVPYKDHGWHEGRLWFVMPFYEGETLERRLRRKPLSRAEARQIFEPLATAVATVHDVGIRHQDIKPENIFLARARGCEPTAEGSATFAMLLDFGVAVRGHERLIAGTPAYFAPEIAGRFADPANAAAASDKLDGFKADIFSLALCLRNALEPSTRQEVRDASEVLAFVRQRAQQSPPLFQDRSLRDLNVWLQRWLHVDAQRRPTAAELAQQLRVLTQPEERRQRRREALRWALPILLSAAALFVLAAAGLQRQVQRQQQVARRARHAEAGLRGDLRGAAHRQRALQGEIGDLRRRDEHLRLSQRELITRVQTLEAQAQQVQRSLEASQERRRALVDTLAQRDTELEKSRTDAIAAQVAVQQEQRAKQRAEQRANTMQGELAAQKREVRQLRMEADEARQALATARRQNDELEEARQDLEADMVDTLNRLERLKRHGASDAQATRDEP